MAILRPTKNSIVKVQLNCLSSGITFAASQARSIHQNKKLKIKVLKCKVDIFFNI